MRLQWDKMKSHVRSIRARLQETPKRVSPFFDGEQHFHNIVPSAWYESSIGRFPPKEQNSRGVWWGGVMSIATEILNLRRDQSSSVSALLAAIEWECAAEEDIRILARGYDVMQAADRVLLNVAAHAADALSELPTIRRNRRAVLPFWRKRRRPDPGQLHQRRLFA